MQEHYFNLLLLCHTQLQRTLKNEKLPTLIFPFNQLIVSYTENLRVASVHFVTLERLITVRFTLYCSLYHKTISRTHANTVIEKVSICCFFRI